MGVQKFPKSEEKLIPPPRKVPFSKTKGQTMTDTKVTPWVSTREFSIDAPKKTCIKYTEDEGDGAKTLIGPLYVKKWFVKDAQRIRVTVEIID